MIRFRLPVFLVSVCLLATACGQQFQRKYDMQPAPDFLFNQRPFRLNCGDRPAPLPPGTNGYVTFSPRAPYARARVDSLNLPLAEVPALTIAAEYRNYVHIEGLAQNRWALQYCAEGEGNTAEEARGYLQSISMTRTGGLLTLNDTHSKGLTGGHGDLFLDAPYYAPLTVHAIGAVEVRDMAGPLHLTATGGRLTILNTTGKVDAQGEIVDFAGSEGNVMLSSESEIDIKLTAAQFQGTLAANAQRPVRVLVPRGFQSPIQAYVNRPKDFVCRADFCSEFKRGREGSLYVFTYAGSDNSSSDHVDLRSMQSTVVIDTANSN
jgi:hypothetical protein